MQQATHCSQHSLHILALTRCPYWWLQTEDDAFPQRFESNADSDAASIITAADDLVSSTILGALLGSDKTQLQDESEVSQGRSVISEDDSVVAQTMGDAMPGWSSPMEGSLDTADWTAFDLEAALRSNADDNLSWSILVSVSPLLIMTLYSD